MKLSLVPEPTKAPWTAANVGTCWRGFEPLYPQKSFCSPSSDIMVDFLPMSIFAQHCDLL